MMDMRIPRNSALAFVLIWLRLSFVATGALGAPMNFTDFSLGPDRSNPAKKAQLISDLKTYASCQASNCYQQEVKQAETYAEAQLVALADKFKSQHPALVLDIDETSLSNLNEMLNNDFGYDGAAPCNSVSSDPKQTQKPICGAIAWDVKAETPALAPTVELFKAAVSHGVTVFFVTGRHEFERPWTAKNLDKWYHGYKDLFMEPNAAAPASASNFKIDARKAIEGRGYHIIVNVGDQLSDLSGGVAEVDVLYPDPFYRVN